MDKTKMNDLVNRLQETGETRLKSGPTDNPKHYLNVVAKLSVSDGKLMLEAKAHIEALEAQIKAADALIEDLLQHEGAERFSHSTYQLEAAYLEIKKQESNGST